MNVPNQKSQRRMQRDAAPAASAQVAAAAEADVADHEVKVALAAYFIAEKRGFEPGHELEDWLAAEAQIDGTAAPSLLTSIPLSPAGSAT
jgi:hypothetical protein